TDPMRDARRRAQQPGRLYLHLMQARLADLLDVDPDDAIAAREERSAADSAGWGRRRFDDAGVIRTIMDEAVTPVRSTARAPSAAVAARRVRWRARIDPLVDERIDAGASAAKTVAAVEEAMAASADAGCVAYKTILAYRTGLAVDPTVTVERAQRELDADA